MTHIAPSEEGPSPTGNSLFALSTAGVVQAPLTPEEIEDGIELPDHPDLGGGLQIYLCDTDFFAEDANVDDKVFGEKHIVWERKDSNEVIDDIKFSPSGEYFAAASHDNAVYLFAVLPGGAAGRGRRSRLFPRRPVCFVWRIASGVYRGA